MISDCDEHGEQLEKGRCRSVTEYDCMRRKHAYDNNGKKCKPPTSANDCQDVGYCSNSMYHTRKECEYHFETWSTSEFSDGKCKRVCPEGYKRYNDFTCLKCESNLENTKVFLEYVNSHNYKAYQKYLSQNGIQKTDLSMAQFQHGRVRAKKGARTTNHPREGMRRKRYDSLPMVLH